ncbi:MAG: bifunctional diaminohydroxyphosphoribosylaminopyrimidine deaminase/5-amino-6-(5-phosphoribosylamino)uracil reductase RibD [Verrucomicrobiales bacterium]|nr:bifunctional diaminohydroxyphosphoribosylaminopyrimidine deaminase/5-amino-6-(5-phosphoribosylamino)uracil reductase RibD [Verrucomicrobiales bacterium]
MPHTEDERWMQEALHEGAKGLGLTSPNPPVGAVIVRDGTLIARGWHRKAGEAHAEVNAIAQAKEQHGEDACLGATIYVTLEPCSTHGRTPPCVNAILEAGFSRVVISSTDPNPDHVGAGFETLRSKGVEVTTGILENEGDELIRFFAKRITSGLPWVIAKTAATLDGRTTLGPEEGQWISCEASREDVQKWRRQCDAIVIGGETFRIDNPSLTLRGPYAEGREQPLRVIFTSDDLLPQTHHLFSDEHRERTRVHWSQPLEESLRSLVDEGANAVMLESGGRLLAHALHLGLVDELILYLAPRLGGGHTRLLPVDGITSELENIAVKQIGSDLRVTGRPRCP